MSSDELEDMIIEWFANSSPNLQIKYDFVARYIAATGSLPIGEITEEKIREILLSEISYTPISLIKKLVGDSEDTPDQECIIAIVKLLMKGHLPTSAQCPSMFVIFITGDGCDLTNYILDSQSDEAKDFGVNLAKVGEKENSIAAKYAPVLLMDEIQ